MPKWINIMELSISAHASIKYCWRFHTTFKYQWIQPGITLGLPQKLLHYSTTQLKIVVRPCRNLTVMLVFVFGESSPNESKLFFATELAMLTLGINDIQWLVEISIMFFNGGFHGIEWHQTSSNDQNCKNYHLVGGLVALFGIFLWILGILSSQLTVILFRGVQTTNQ